MEETKIDLLDKQPVVINIGIPDFYDTLVAQEVQVIQVAWKPPASGDAELIDLLDQLL